LAFLLYFVQSLLLVNKAFDEWIHEQLLVGAKQLFSNIEHPWENGRAERSFQTLFMKARSMMKYANLPTGTWGRAILHAVYLINRSPSSRTQGLSPLQFRTGILVDFTKLRLFGSPAQIYIRPSNRNSDKLSNRSEHGTFLGMSSKGNSYIFRVDRHNTIVEVDSRDIRDRKSILLRGGVILPPDLHITPESKFDLPSQDEIIAPPASTRPVPSNRFESLSNSLSAKSNPIVLQNKDPKPATGNTSACARPSHKNWKYVQDHGPTGKGDRKNDGPKSVSFFQVPDPKSPGPNRRSSRNITPSSPNPVSSPARVQSALMQSSDEYNPELYILLSFHVSNLKSLLIFVSYPLREPRLYTKLSH
jgi:hypothetical protein